MLWSLVKTNYRILDFVDLIKVVFWMSIILTVMMGDNGDDHNHKDNVDKST